MGLSATFNANRHEDTLLALQASYCSLGGQMSKGHVYWRETAGIKCVVQKEPV